MITLHKLDDTSEWWLGFLFRAGHGRFFVCRSSHDAWDFWAIARSVWGYLGSCSLLSRILPLLGGCESHHSYRWLIAHLEKCHSDTVDGTYQRCLLTFKQRLLVLKATGVFLVNPLSQASVTKYIGSWTLLKSAMKPYKNGKCESRIDTPLGDWSQVCHQKQQFHAKVHSITCSTGLRQLIGRRKGTSVLVSPYKAGWLAG